MATRAVPSPHADGHFQITLTRKAHAQRRGRKAGKDREKKEELIRRGRELRMH